MSLLERIQKEKSVEVVDNKAQKVKKTQVAQEDPYAKLTELKKLLDAGVITQEDFDAQKSKLLG